VVLHGFETCYRKQKETVEGRMRQRWKFRSSFFLPFHRGGGGGAAQALCVPAWCACTLTAGRGVGLEWSLSSSFTAVKRVGHWVPPAIAARRESTQSLCPRQLKPPCARDAVQTAACTQRLCECSGACVSQAGTGLPSSSYHWHGGRVTWRTDHSFTSHLQDVRHLTAQHDVSTHVWRECERK
jgi:hypothetical protein